MNFAVSGGPEVLAARKKKLHAAEKLLAAMEEDCGRKLFEEEDEVLENLSKRQDAVSEMLAAHKALQEILAAHETSSRTAEEAELDANTDKIILRIQELYRKDIDEANHRVRMYKEKIQQLKANRERLLAYTKSAAHGGKHFEVKG